MSDAIEDFCAYYGEDIRSSVHEIELKDIEIAAKDKEIAELKEPKDG